MNIPCVLPAGMVNVAVRPPALNWMAGSSAGTFASEANVRVTVPVSGTGNVPPSVTVTFCCCAGGGVSVTPPMVTPDTCGRATASAKRALAVSESASVTVTLNAPATAAVGVPVMRPEESIDSPAGNVSALSRYGRVPPVASIFAEYAMPAVAAGSGDALVIRTGVVTWPVNGLVAVSLFASVTVAAKEYVPAAEGLPLMAPVPESRLRPAGSDPPLTDHV